MSNSISGNCGLAGVTVNLTGSSIATTTTDISGNYIFNGLSAGTYTVTPTLTGYQFWYINTGNCGYRPNISITIISSNFSNQSFAAISTTTNFNVLASDALNESDGPLDPSKWSDMTGFNFAELDIASGSCQADNADGNTCAEQYTGITWGDDQWAQIKFTHFQNTINGDTESSIWLRSDSGGENAYQFSFAAKGNGTLDVNLNVFVGNSQVAQPLATQSAGVPAEDGDIFRVASIGTTHIIWQNGNVIGVCTDTNVASGAVNIEITVNTDVTTVRLNNFSGGNFAPPTPSGAYSVPDDRNYSVFPNNAINVQGTETYTVPAHPSTVVPVDSRLAGAPVDSRVAAIIPENSRTPGTYGPGE